MMREDNIELRVVSRRIREHLFDKLSAFLMATDSTIFPKPVFKRAHLVIIYFPALDDLA